MVAMNEATWIEANVEVVKNYLKKEFENFAIAHQASQSLEHTGITGHLQIRTHPPLRQRRLCVFEEKKAHPLSLFEARVVLR